MVLSSDLQKEIEDIVSKAMQTWIVPGLLGESLIPCIKIPED